MKKLTARIIVFLFLGGLLFAGLKSCDTDYGYEYSDPYGGSISEQMP